MIIFVVLCALPGAVAQLNTDRLMSVGRNALYFEDFVLSIQYFNQVIRVKPQLTDPYFFRGIAKIQLEDYVGAETDLNVVIERNPFIPMAYYARGFALSHLGRWDEAATDFTMALQYSPDNVVYMVNRIEAFRMGRRYFDALTDIDLLLRHYPSSVDFHFEKGIIQLESADTVGALGTFARVTELDSVNSDAWSAYATVAMMMGDDSVAAAGFERAVDLGSQSLSTYINSGILNYRGRRYRDALQDYDRAVAIDSTSFEALFNRALLRTEVGDYNGAVVDLNRIVRLHPDMYEAVYQRAIVNGIIGEDDAAIDDYTMLIGRYPEFVPALYARADIYDRMGREKDAFADRDRAYMLRMEYESGKRTGGDTVSVDARVSDIDSRRSIDAIVQLFDTDPDSRAEEGVTGARGAVQNRDVSLEEEPNVMLTYYRQQADNLPIAPYNPKLLQEVNGAGGYATLYLVAREVRLSSSMINHHFEAVNRMSERIAREGDCAQCYFLRGIDYAIVQDFANAIDDFTKSILLDGDNAMAYFCRANIRYKQLVAESDDMLETDVKGTGGAMPAGVSALPGAKGYSGAYEMIMRDYDYTIALAPDFAFAWYNRANLLTMQRDYEAAVDNYTRAVDIEPRLAEAYFNRGLTYILMAEYERAIRDLSKAGELGIYRAYGIIKRLQDK